MRITDFGYNQYTQSGEDGIIEKIFELIGTRSKRCIEFGATDGLFLSNTARLWQNGWQAVLIEGETKYIPVLETNIAAYRDSVIAINEFVTIRGEHTLENILRRAHIPFEVDLLSIDIDGDDYYIFQSLDELRPRVVICEFNPTIPLDFEFVPEETNYIGCSARSLISLAQDKGYRLVAMTDNNAIFVLKEEFHHFAEYETSQEALMPTQNLVYLITSYNGRYLLSKKPPFGMAYPYNGHPVKNDLFMVPQPEDPSVSLYTNIRRLLKSLLRR